MKVAVEQTSLSGVVVVRPQVFRDDRGTFMELFREDAFAEVGLPTRFVQLNRSRSRRNVVRGLHFQWDPPMGKLMTVTRGRAFLVAVDLRFGSPTIGKWVAVTLSEEDRACVWAPASFARGFCALSDEVDIDYLCTGTYNGSAEAAIRWDDPEIAIDWPVTNAVVSDKDRAAGSLSDWMRRPEAAAFSFGPTGNKE